MTGLTSLIDAQEALIAALDTADPRQIEQASTHMAGIIEAMRSDGIDSDGHDRSQIEAARARNIDAAKRVNSLTSWTRSKLERVNEMRGGTPLARPTPY